MAEDFWLRKADVYSNEKFEINELGTHPRILNYYRQYNNNWKTLLDYGCGDGSFIQKLGEYVENLEVSLFDTSKSMLDIAGKNLVKLRPRIFENPLQLPDQYFDCVILSMVLICVDKEEELLFIADRILRSKKKDGYLIVANPHPCFRDKPFSSYYTEYTVGRPFNYYNNGERHRIFMRDKSIDWYDYNWSISFIINLFIKKGFSLVEMEEVRDNRSSDFFNTAFAPSLIYVFK